MLTQAQTLVEYKLCQVLPFLRLVLAWIGTRMDAKRDALL